MQKTITCFLIDDDRDEYDIFSIALKQLKHKVTCVYSSDAREALDLLQNDSSFDPDFILIDINMPRMNGLQCLAEMKRNERLRETPIYMYSTSASESIVQQCLELGATDYIVKPVSILEIEQTIARIVEQLATINPS